MANRLRFKKNNIASFVDSFYPIGAVYISFDSTNPSNFFRGTWERIRSRFLLAADEDKYIVNRIGGEETHTLTINEMPSHTHTQNPHSHGINYNPQQNSSGHPSVTHHDVATMVHYGYIENTTAINNNTGGGASHNNMPPYITVYMWKRVS